MIDKPYSPTPTPDDPVWLVNAFGEVGTKEIVGADHHPRVVEYHACTGLGATNDETPWCSSFICWVMMKSNIVSTRSAASLSWLRWGKELKTPVRGCVVIFERMGANGHPIPNRGHVALYLGQKGHVTYVLGGNQKNQVGINAYRTDRVIGYRWPSLPHNSTTNIASTTAGAGAVVASAPTIMGLINTVTDPDSPVTKVAGKAQELSSGLGIPVSSAVALVGLAVALAGAVYIVRERNKKIRAFGI